jgi:hypothetical protein
MERDGGRSMAFTKNKDIKFHEIFSMLCNHDIDITVTFLHKIGDRGVGPRQPGKHRCGEE